jgi:SAM domain (Sterile alpha motif)
MQRKENAEALSATLLALHHVTESMTAKQFFQETKNDHDDNQVSLLDRLREIEELSVEQVQQWLAEHKTLSRYADTFGAERICGSALFELTQRDLRIELAATANSFSSIAGRF